jgi:hypothetical protein
MPTIKRRRLPPKKASTGHLGAGTRKALGWLGQDTLLADAAELTARLDAKQLTPVELEYIAACLLHYDRLIRSLQGLGCSAHTYHRLARNRKQPYFTDGPYDVAEKINRILGQETK